MQVAIASSDARTVDGHFGKAGRFLIYEIEVGFQTLLAIRVVTPYSDGDQSHDFNRARFDEVAGKLAGCKRLYCAKIGEKPAEELRKLGIEPVVCSGPIAGITGM